MSERRHHLPSSSCVVPGADSRRVAEGIRIEIFETGRGGSHAWCYRSTIGGQVIQESYSPSRLMVVDGMPDRGDLVKTIIEIKERR